MFNYADEEHTQFFFRCSQEHMKLHLDSKKDTVNIIFSFYFWNKLKSIYVYETSDSKSLWISYSSRENQNTLYSKDELIEVLVV